MPTETTELRRLLDSQACADTLARYCRALDWLDEELPRTAFTADAEIHYCFFKGTASEFVPFVIGVEQSFTRRWHVGANVVVLVDGDTAQAESHCMAAATTEAGGSRSASSCSTGNTPPSRSTRARHCPG